MPIDTTELKRACSEELQKGKTALNEIKSMLPEHGGMQKAHDHLLAAHTACTERIGELLNALPDEPRSCVEHHINGPAKAQIPTRDAMLAEPLNELISSGREAAKLEKVLKPLIDLRRMIAKVLDAVRTEDLWRLPDDTVTSTDDLPSTDVFHPGADSDVVIS